MGPAWLANLGVSAAAAPAVSGCEGLSHRAELGMPGGSRAWPDLGVRLRSQMAAGASMGPVELDSLGLQ